MALFFVGADLRRAVQHGSRAQADFRPRAVAAEKIKKSGEGMTLELENTTDIAAELGREATPPADPPQQDGREAAARLKEIGIRTFRPASAGVSDINADILTRLDAIILEAVLLKQEIQKSR